MTGKTPSPLVRAGVMALTLAVVLCLVIPMGADDAQMHLALACCFVLAVALSVFLLRPSVAAVVRGNASRLSVSHARGPARTARAPDLFSLGSLLI